MYKYCIGIIGLIISGISSFAFADLGGFTIEGYNVDMALHTDGSMNVKETINVDFSEQRHGIYRYIPIQDPQGDYIHITNLTVVGDPIANLTIENNMYNLKIGDKDTYISGLKTYTIAYTVQNAIKAYSSGTTTRQELYRNTIGNQWATTIKNPTFSISLPKEYAFSSGAMIVIRGGYGETNTQLSRIQRLSGTEIIGGVATTLNPEQGVTVGLQFPANYFIADSNYNSLFSQKPSLGFRSGLISGRETTMKYWFPNGIGDIGHILFFGIISIIFHLGFKKRGSITGRKSAWKSNKAITPYYLPPQKIDAGAAFWFWYNAQNPQIFVALLYYWATKGRIQISLTAGKKYFFGMKGADTYIINELIENPHNATELDKILLQKFFGPRDNIQDKVKLTQDSYEKMTRVLGELEAQCDGEKKWYQRQGAFFTKKYILTADGEQLFEEMRGYKEFLEKVERPAIEKELQNNPDFFNMILPWAVLFGIETRLLDLCEDMLQQVTWYDSYNGSLLNASSFYSMTSGITSSVIAPRSSGSSSGSGFGGGGFSGGGGGGGGGGSW